MDNGSVFTKNLSDYLVSINADFQLYTFDKIDLKSLDNYDSFILSGRRSNDKQMNVLNSKVIQHCVEESKKLLGICYGAELLVLTLGGTIHPMPYMQKGNQTVTATKSNSLMNSAIEVYESHKYEISKLGDSFVSIGTSIQCTHEIIQHKHGKIFGTQFHPEMTRDGQSLIKKFLDL